MLHASSQLTGLYNDVATCERIANKTMHTSTDRTMVDRSTDGIQATHARTRINASLIDTRFGGRALRTDGAFGAAVGRRTHIFGNARAHRVTLDDATVAIQTARRWSTWILNWNWQIAFALGEEREWTIRSIRKRTRSPKSRFQIAYYCRVSVGMSIADSR